MIALAWPIFDALGQLAGFALNCFAVHAFCTVVSREGELLGEFDFDDVGWFRGLSNRGIPGGSRGTASTRCTRRGLDDR